MLPKVHKNLDTQPGRLIVAGIGGLCENACTFVDFYLQPLVSSLPSFLQDSMATIRELERLRLDGPTLLVTCDVESLYTNISHTNGMAAMTHFLEGRENFDGMLDSFVIDLLDFILQHNYFVFNNTFYKQVSGTAMGARCDPSYANLFLYQY